MVDRVNPGEPIRASWANDLVDNVNQLSNMGGDVTLNRRGKFLAKISKEQGVSPNVIECQHPKVKTSSYEQWNRTPLPYEICYLRSASEVSGYVAEPPSEEGLTNLGVLLSDGNQETLQVLTSGVVIVFSEEEIEEGERATAIAYDDEFSQATQDDNGPFKILTKVANTERWSLYNNLESIADIAGNTDLIPYLARMEQLGGGGGGLLLEAQEDMIKDYDDTDEDTIEDTTYEAKPVLSDGTLGSTIDVIRPPGVKIRDGQRGILSISDNGMNVFSLDTTNIEVRTDDPDSPAVGRIWFRKDKV